MHKICFYIPETHKEMVKQKMFDLGAGKIGAYDHCCWETKGMGQYRPLPGSNPTKGKKNDIHHEEEYQVEMICCDDLIHVVLQAMIKNHPYEEPAYSARPIMTADNLNE